MKKLVIILLMTLAFISCDNEPTLQEYYVNNTENVDFLALDIPVSSLGLETTAFTAKEKAAYESVRKLNILAFKLNANNKMEYEVEKDKVKAILANSKYHDLMTIGAGNKKASIKYLGDDNAIDEVVIFGDSNEMGFALVRVLGDDMNPANMMSLMKAIEKADFQGDQFKQLEDFLKQK